MRKRIVLICILTVLLAIGIGVGVSYAATEENVFSLAGQYLSSVLGNGSVGTDSSQVVMARYDGEAITSTMVTYQRKLNILRSEEYAADNDTDIEIINNIITDMILVEEAQRLGLTATEAEIEAMVQNAVRAYSLPEGKEMLDAYCDGAGITFDEYLAILEEQAPSIIAKQNLRDAIGMQYCEENGLEFTKVNPPAGMTAAQEAYIEALFEQNKDKIEYLIDVPADS